MQAREGCNSHSEMPHGAYDSLYVFRRSLLRPCERSSLQLWDHQACKMHYKDCWSLVCLAWLDSNEAAVQSRLQSLIYMRPSDLPAAWHGQLSQRLLSQSSPLHVHAAKVIVETETECSTSYDGRPDDEEGWKPGRHDKSLAGQQAGLSGCSWLHAVVLGCLSTMCHLKRFCRLPCQGFA